MLYNHHSDIEKMEEVELIASGYEWTCPNCDALNNETEITAVVKCEGCHYLYRTGEANHAHGTSAYNTDEPAEIQRPTHPLVTGKGIRHANHNHPR